MTFKRFKSLVTGLLVGDNILPDDPDAILALFEMAVSDISSQACSLHLMTLDRNNEISRMGVGDYLVRKPELPVKDDDVLDIDEELCFPLARLLAGYLSNKKTPYHQSEANRLIKVYNSQVNEVLESIKDNGKA